MNSNTAGTRAQGGPPFAFRFCSVRLFFKTKKGRKKKQKKKGKKKKPCSFSWDLKLIHICAVLV